MQANEVSFLQLPTASENEIASRAAIVLCEMLCMQSHDGKGLHMRAMKMRLLTGQYCICACAGQHLESPMLPTASVLELLCTAVAATIHSTTHEVVLCQHTAGHSCTSSPSVQALPSKRGSRGRSQIENMQLTWELRGLQKRSRKWKCCHSCYRLGRIISRTIGRNGRKAFEYKNCVGGDSECDSSTLIEQS